MGSTAVAASCAVEKRHLVILLHPRIYQNIIIQYIHVRYAFQRKCFGWHSQNSVCWTTLSCNVHVLNYQLKTSALNLHAGCTVILQWSVCLAAGLIRPGGLNSFKTFFGEKIYCPSVCCCLTGNWQNDNQWVLAWGLDALVVNCVQI